MSTRKQRDEMQRSTSLSYGKHKKGVLRGGRPQCVKLREKPLMEAPGPGHKGVAGCLQVPAAVGKG